MANRLGHMLHVQRCKLICTAQLRFTFYATLSSVFLLVLLCGKYQHLHCAPLKFPSKKILSFEFLATTTLAYFTVLVASGAYATLSSNIPSA